MHTLYSLLFICCYYYVPFWKVYTETAVAIVHMTGVDFIWSRDKCGERGMLNPVSASLYC